MFKDTPDGQTNYCDHKKPQGREFCERCMPVTNLRYSGRCHCDGPYTCKIHDGEQDFCFNISCKCHNATTITSTDTFKELAESDKDIAFCQTCIQMTNHLKGKCLKCEWETVQPGLTPPAQSNNTKECQWENCSGGEYCSNHSLISSPAQIWEERFENWKNEPRPTGYEYTTIVTSPEDLKTFIAHELSLAEQEWRKKMREEVEALDTHLFGSFHSRSPGDQYLKLQDVIQIILK